MKEENHSNVTHESFEISNSDTFQDIVMILEKYFVIFQSY